MGNIAPPLKYDLSKGHLIHQGEIQDHQDINISQSQNQQRLVNTYTDTVPIVVRDPGPSIDFKQSVSAIRDNLRLGIIKNDMITRSSENAAMQTWNDKNEMYSRINSRSAQGELPSTLPPWGPGPNPNTPTVGIVFIRNNCFSCDAGEILIANTHLIDVLANGNRVGIITFNGSGTVTVLPLTTINSLSRNTIKAALNTSGSGSPGNMTGAVQAAKNMLATGSFILLNAWGGTYPSSPSCGGQVAAAALLSGTGIDPFVAFGTPSGYYGLSWWDPWWTLAHINPDADWYWPWEVLCDGVPWGAWEIIMNNTVIPHLENHGISMI